MSREFTTSVVALKPFGRAARRSHKVRRPGGVVVGRVDGLDEDGNPLVTFARNPAGRPVAARSIVAVSPGDVGRDAVLAFERGNRRKPLVMGLIRDAQPAAAHVTVDGQTLELSGRRQIVLRCGRASITLTRAGKVLIRGAYLLSRSSGANRIKGGSVQIN